MRELKYERKIYVPKFRHRSRHNAMIKLGYTFWFKGFTSESILSPFNMKSKLKSYYISIINHMKNILKDGKIIDTKKI